MYNLTARRTLGLILAVMLILLAGCQLPFGARNPGTAPTPKPSSAQPAPTPTTPVNNHLAFTKGELFTGKEINFPTASEGRVAVLLFFSTG